MPPAPTTNPTGNQLVGVSFPQLQDSFLDNLLFAVSVNNTHANGYSQRATVTRDDNDSGDDDAGGGAAERTKGPSGKPFGTTNQDKGHRCAALLDATPKMRGWPACLRLLRRHEEGDVPVATTSNEPFGTGAVVG